MPDLMGMKNILVLNDEAHHCYREKPGDEDDEDLKGDEKKEAEKNNEAARLWISGLEAVNRKLGVSRVIDLSATPFFLQRLGLRRRHAVPVDHERLFAHGRHRVRHRQTAARPRRRQHPRRRDADVPQPVGEHPQGHAQEGPRQGQRHSIRSACPPQLADRPRSPLRPLREDLQALARSGHPRPALLHRRLPEHRHLEAGLRLHLRLSAARTRTAPRRWKTAASPLFRNFDETRQPACRARTRC